MLFDNEQQMSISTHFHCCTVLKSLTKPSCVRFYLNYTQDLLDNKTL